MLHIESAPNVAFLWKNQNFLGLDTPSTLTILDPSTYPLPNEILATRLESGAVSKSCVMFSTFKVRPARISETRWYSRSIHCSFFIDAYSPFYTVIAVPTTTIRQYILLLIIWLPFTANKHEYNILSMPTCQVKRFEHLFLVCLQKKCRNHWRI